MHKALQLIERMRPLMEMSGEGNIVKCDYASGAIVVRSDDNSDFEVDHEVAKSLADQNQPLQMKRVKFSTSMKDGKEVITSLNVIE